MFNLEDRIVLYDLTNTYFEGLCVRNPNAEFNGNQKEKKSKIEILVKKDGNMSYLLCKSWARHAQESAMRNNMEKKLEQDLTSLI